MQVLIRRFADEYRKYKRHTIHYQINVCCLYYYYYYFIYYDLRVFVRRIIDYSNKIVLHRILVSRVRVQHHNIIAANRSTHDDETVHHVCFVRIYFLFFLWIITKNDYVFKIFLLKKKKKGPGNVTPVATLLPRPIIYAYGFFFRATDRRESPTTTVCSTNCRFGRRLTTVRTGFSSSGESLVAFRRRQGRTRESQGPKTGTKEGTFPRPAN